MSFALYQILQFILREIFIPCSVNEVKFVNNSNKPGPHHGSCFIKIPALIIITGTRAYSTDIKRYQKRNHLTNLRRTCRIPKEIFISQAGAD